MTESETDPAIIRTILGMQRGEITEHHIYKKIASAERNSHNRDVLTRIAEEELGHYSIWKHYTGQDVAPDTSRIWYYYLLARILGITFAIKLMEGVEKRAQSFDKILIDTFPEIQIILAHEEAHERELIAVIDEDRSGTWALSCSGSTTPW